MSQVASLFLSFYETASKGWKALFDTSFRELITDQVIRVVYVLAIFASAYYSLAMFLRFRQVSNGLWAFFCGFICFLLLVMASRVALEVVMVIFRIAENTTVIADKIRMDRAAASAPTVAVEAAASVEVIAPEPETIVAESPAPVAQETAGAPSA